MSTYYALKTLAESGITFDGVNCQMKANVGGDQGLLNTFFPTYHRLSFTYNVTPSTNYQYTPAYKYYSSNISLFHFIGRTKPWDQRHYTGIGSLAEATARWWSVYEKHFGWKIREEELKRIQETALQSRGRDTTPRPHPTAPSLAQAVTPGPEPLPKPVQPTYAPFIQPEARPFTAERVTKQETFGTPDAAFFHPPAPAPVPTPKVITPPPPPPGMTPAPYVREPSPTRRPSPPRHPSPPRQYSPPRQHSPPRQSSPPPFEPTLVHWDPARSAPPPDAGPEARNLTFEAYRSAWDRPYDAEEPKWIPPPPSPLPKGYDYSPPPAPLTLEAHETSSESEDEIEERDDQISPSERPEDVKEQLRRKERYVPIFPWEMRSGRQAATRVFPGDEPPEAKPTILEPRPYNRRASLEEYEFTNA